MIESYLATYDYNLPLRDAERDPDLSPRRRMLAAIGCHVALDSGYYDAQALASGLLDIASESNEGLGDGRSGASDRLQDLLARDDLGFQKALHRVIAIAPAADAAADICWLTELMRQRADMVRLMRALGLNPTLPDR